MNHLEFHLDLDGPPAAPSEAREFRVLMERLRAGDQAAAREVHERWTARLIGLTRARLGRLITEREDPEDVVQSVYRSFFRRYRDSNYQLVDWTDVWALLATIATRKCINRRLYYSAECRAPSRETSREPAEFISTDPAPEDAAALAELVERMLRRVPLDQRPIVEMSLQGFTVKEISARLGRATRSVYRVREYVREWLLSQTADL